DRSLLCGLRAHALGREPAAERHIDDVDQHATAPALELARKRGGGSCLDVPLGNDRIHQAQRSRPARADIAAGEHHAHRFDRIDEPRQAYRAAETGMEPEHHFGKPEPRILDRDAVVACERKLETAAQAVAVNNGDDGHAQPIEAIDYRMRLVQTIYDEGDIGHAAEFADGRAGNEAASVRRAQHHAHRPLEFDTREYVTQFGEHLL